MRTPHHPRWVRRAGTGLLLLAVAPWAGARIVQLQPPPQPAAAPAAAPVEPGAGRAPGEDVVQPSDAPTTLQNAIRRPAANRAAEDDAAAGERALAGDVAAMLDAGWRFYRNPSLPQAQAQALKWWGQAARAGNPRGMAAYGYLLGTANGSLRDLAASQEWLDRAALGGVARALYLSALVEKTRAGPRQATQVRAQLERAARLGDAFALNDLGVEYELAGDTAGATELYTRAAAAGVEVARQNLARLQRPAGQRGGGGGGGGESLERLRERANTGDADALLQIAYRYHLGRGGVQRDFARAIQYYQRAAAAGSRRAQEFLALILSRTAQGQAGPSSDAWMEELTARVNAAAMWREAGETQLPERPLRVPDPLAGLVHDG